MPADVHLQLGKLGVIHSVPLGKHSGTSNAIITYTSPLTQI